MTAIDLQRVADHWDNEQSWETTPGLYWLQLDAVQRRWNTKMSGREDADWVDHAIATHLAGRLPLARCLSLGCGAGGLERQLAALAVFESCEAVDISEGSIRRAREAAEAAGYRHIEYSVGDLNEIRLTEASYDAIWAAGAVHHVASLEHLLSQAAAALKPRGLLFMNEYIGPSRFQFPARQREVIQACNMLLPDQYRQIVAARLQGAIVPVSLSDAQSLSRRIAAKIRGRDLLPALWRHAQRLAARQTGTRPHRNSVSLPTAASVAAIDPSEAVRSAEIVPILRRHFDIIEQRPLGGGILHFLLADIAGNFETVEGQRLLQMLFQIEDILMESGDLASDFAFIVARPRSHQVGESATENVSGAAC